MNTAKVDTTDGTVSAEELQTSVGSAVKAAQKAVRTDEASRAQRIRDLKAELERISGLETRAKALAPVATRVPA